jgi:N-acetylglucosamine-6-phosphate deacetylase
MHMHGAFGIGFESVSGGADLVAIASRLEAFGVGCFVPTILWDEGAVDRLVAAIEESWLPESVLPGIYIEGPFVNAERRGGIGLGQIAAPDPDLCRKIIATAKGRLKVMALAPELPGIEALYPILEEAGVLVSLGHSGASAGVALPPSRFSVTHLFNAMSGLDHRGGGLVNIALAGFPSWTELNADGIHVNKSAMKVASLCIPPERLILTSDAVISAGLPYGDFSYFGKSVTSGPDGTRYKESGTLIGSNRLGMEIIKSFSASTGASLPAAIQSMSATPSAALGLAAVDCGGNMEVGAKADIFIWDSNLSVCRRPVSSGYGDGTRAAL